MIKILIEGEGEIRLFVDDDFDSPVRIKLSKNYTHWVSTEKEAIELLETGKVTSISLDHDLGDEKTQDCGNGYGIAKWIEEAAFSNRIPKLSWRCHTANSIGYENMVSALKSADKFWDKRK